MINKEELLQLVDKVSAYNNTPTVVIYDYLPEEEKKNIRIEDGKEVWYGVKVIRL
jgi:hypothetical protein